MQKTTLSFLISSIIFLAVPLSAQIYINEFVASNSFGITDAAGEQEDWVEIYNAGSAPVNLAGHYFTDDLNEPTLWQIPGDNPAAVTVPAGGYLIFWFDKDTDNGPTHIDAKLSADGEDVGLFAPDGSTLIDGLTYGAQTVDVSFGRSSDGANDFVFFNSPTPGAANFTSGGAQAQPPTADTAGGLFSGSVSVGLTSPTPGATIYYTTDGSEPDASDNVYNGSLQFFQPTALRAVAVFNGGIPSEIMTENYLVNVNHAFPVVALTVEPDDFFGPEGVYTLFEEDIEVNVNVEFFDTDGTTGFNQVVETEINGVSTAGFGQKSLALKAKGSLGDATMSYQIFPDSDFEEYRSLILRNSGNDYFNTYFRDALASSLVADIDDTDDIITPPLIYGQNYRPVIAYINGEYTGIYNLRERSDKRYIRANFGLDDDEIDLIENESEVKEGDIEAWNELQNELASTDYADADNFAQLAEKVDVDAYLDNMVFNLYIDNQDYPGNNNRRFRERTADGKWRWLTYDLDFSMGLYTTEGWDTGYAFDNSLERWMNPTAFNWPNPEWSTRLFTNLLENEGWRTRLINRTADQMNILYRPERITERIDAYYETYQPEFTQHNNQWGNLWNQAASAQKMKNFVNDRPAFVLDMYEAAFAEITGNTQLTVNAVPANGGSVRLSTLNLRQEFLPWSGVYFTGVNIPVTAIPEPGFVLDFWSGAAAGNDSEIDINLGGAANLTAHFTQGSTQNIGVVINEINYNSADESNSGDWIEFHNPTGQTADISGWYLRDEEDDYFVFPQNTFLPAGGFLVLVEDLNEFTAIYPGVSNIAGEFGDNSPFGKMKLSNGGENLELYNAAQTVIDAVNYDDSAPWPEAADGDGPTLQLTDPTSDNANAQSWTACAATPGTTNNCDGGGTPVLLSQTIDFPIIGDKLTTDTPFFVPASASSGLPVTLTVLSGPASFSGGNLVLTGAVGQVTVQAVQGGNADYNPAAPVTRTFNVTEESTPTEPQDYCVSASEAPWFEWIARVRLNDLDHSSGKSQYSDFTNQTVTLAAGQMYNLTLTEGISYFTEDVYWRVWIDYNRDGVFATGETAYSGVLSGIADGTPTADAAGQISVPAGVTGGTTRMRVTMKRGAYATPCETYGFGETEDYSVEITGDGGGGTPVQLTQSIDFPIIGNKLNTDAPFTVAASASSGLPVTLTVLSGPAFFSSGNLVLTGAVGQVTVQATQVGNTAYFPASAVTRTFSVTEENTPTEPQGYCASEGEFPWHEWIARVRLNNLDHNSGKNKYSDFTAQTANLAAGQTHEILLTEGISYFTEEVYWRVWIDYDRNGIFDNSETAFSGILSGVANGTPTADLAGQITVPTGVNPGPTRMRITMKVDAYASPCETYDFGETEDYTVNITPGFAPLSLEVYPNPAGATFYVNARQDAGNAATLQILDAQGTTLREENFVHLPAAPIAAETEGLRPGMYFVVLRAAGKRVRAARIFVERGL